LTIHEKDLIDSGSTTQTIMGIPHQPLFSVPEKRINWDNSYIFGYCNRKSSNHNNRYLSKW